MDNSCTVVTGLSLSLCNHCIIYEQLTKLNSGCDDTHKCRLVLVEWGLAEKGVQVLLCCLHLGEITLGGGVAGSLGTVLKWDVGLVGDCLFPGEPHQFSLKKFNFQSS